MRNPRKHTRRGRERGSALIVALVMLVLIIASIELMLAAPNAELVKVKSTVAKEHAQASANAGVQDVFNWLMAHRTTLSQYLDDPTGTPPQLAVGKNIVLTSQTALAANNTGGNGDGAAASLKWINGTGLTTGSSYPNQNGPLTVQTSGNRAGLYPFPTFCDNQSYYGPAPTPSPAPLLTAPNVNANFVRFGDPVISRGEYAYQIASLGGGFYEVDVEGRALGTTAGNINSPSKFVSRITAVIRKNVIPTSLPASANSMNPNGGSGVGQILADANSGGAGKIAISGANQTPSTGPTTTAGLAIQSTTTSYYSVTGNTVAAGAGSAGGSGSGSVGLGSPGSGPPAIVGGTASTPPSFTIDQQIVNMGQALTPSSGTPTSTTPWQSITYGGATTSFSPAVGVSAFYYMKIPPGSNVTGPLFTVSGTPGQTGGVIVIDVGSSNPLDAAVTFNLANSGLIQGDGNHPFSGAVIFYQEGSPVSTTYVSGTGAGATTYSNSLPLFYQNGNQPGGLQFASTPIQAALSVFPPSFSIVSYTVEQ